MWLPCTSQKVQVEDTADRLAVFIWHTRIHLPRHAVLISIDFLTSRARKLISKTARLRTQTDCPDYVLCGGHCRTCCESTIHRGFAHDVGASRTFFLKGLREQQLQPHHSQTVQATTMDDFPHLRCYRGATCKAVLKGHGSPTQFCVQTRHALHNTKFLRA
jgi:hypothetical protein